jgi:uncharacterized protein (DUF1684 family)
MMKRILTITISLALLSCGNTETNVSKQAEMHTTTSVLADAQQFQNELKTFYLDEKKSPLSAADKKDFKGIDFFPLNEKFIVKALFSKIDSAAILPFPTSAKKIKYFKEYGKLQFEIEGVRQELTLYESVPPIAGYEDELFLPFKDGTTGRTSYGAGRYLDVHKKDIVNDSLIIDFNKAYNPYCAYSSDYNCPIPPNSNTLKGNIEAGVRYLLLE